MRTLHALRVAILIVVASLFSGCVAFQLPSDDGGRSGLQQLLLARTIDQAVADINLTSDAVFDRRVYIVVGDVEREQVVSDYIMASMAMKLIFMNASVVDSPSEADVLLYVKVQSAGVDATSAPFSLASILKSLLYTSDSMRARAELEVNALDQGQEGGMVYPQNLTASARNSYRQFQILLNLIGPFKHSTIRGMKY